MRAATKPSRKKNVSFIPRFFVKKRFLSDVENLERDCSNVHLGLQVNSLVTVQAITHILASKPFLVQLCVNRFAKFC